MGARVATMASAGTDCVMVEPAPTTAPTRTDAGTMTVYYYVTSGNYTPVAGSGIRQDAGGSVGGTVVHHHQFPVSERLGDQ